MGGVLSDWMGENQVSLREWVLRGGEETWGKVTGGRAPG